MHYPQNSIMYFAMKAQKFPEIIERVEQVRRYLSLNKTQFSRAIGMKPQTYNNFIGQQASKPSIDLIYGVVNELHVNPMWLLNGIGAIFLTPHDPT